MKMLRILILPAVALLSSVIISAVIKDTPTAYSNGSDIIVRWNTLDESGVQRFEVHRRSGTDGPFLQIGQQRPRGNNSAYEYVDKQVFKAANGVYQYKIRIIDGSNPPNETDVVTVSHLSSAYKRTWGSIKAMFR